MLQEINKNYYWSIKKTILDYVLLEDSEKVRLGIAITFDTVSTWG